MGERRTSGSSQSVADWLRCPECGSEDVHHSVNNGRLHLNCEECWHTLNRLVGRSTFR